MAQDFEGPHDLGEEGAGRLRIFCRRAVVEYWRDDGDGDYFAAGGFHFFAADDLVVGPVAAFYEDVGEECGDGFARGGLVEDDYGVDAVESGEEFGAFTFGDDWAACAFQLGHAGVAVETDDQCVA